jgi:hypothetical protein
VPAFSRPNLPLAAERWLRNGTAYSGGPNNPEFGDINESFYNSLESVLNEMAQLLMQQGREIYPQFRERVQSLTTHADHIGWGYGDFLRDQVSQLENTLAGG